MRQPPLIAVAVLVALVGCGGDEPAGTGTSAVDAGTAEGAANAEVQDGGGSAEGGAVDLPRTLTYAGTVWTVDAAEVVDEVSPDADSPVEAPHARLDVSVESTLEGTNLSIPPDLVALVDEEGIVHRAEAFLDDGEEIFRLEVPAQGRTSATVLVPIPEAAALADLTFEVAETGETPARVALSGESEATVYPIDVPVPTDTRRVPMWPNPADVRLLDASVTLDDGAERADEGTRFLRVGLRATGTTNLAGGTAFRSTEFQLVVDGVTRAPERLDLGGPVRTEESVDGDVVFAVPLDAQDVQLEIGAPGGEQERYPLDLPPAEFLSSS